MIGVRQDMAPTGQDRVAISTKPSKAINAAGEKNQDQGSTALIAAGPSAKETPSLNSIIPVDNEEDGQVVLMQRIALPIDHAGFGAYAYKPIPGLHYLLTDEPVSLPKQRYPKIASKPVITKETDTVIDNHSLKAMLDHVIVAKPKADYIIHESKKSVNIASKKVAEQQLEARPEQSTLAVPLDRQVEHAQRSEERSQQPSQTDTHIQEPQRQPLEPCNQFEQVDQIQMNRRSSRRQNLKRKGSKAQIAPRSVLDNSSHRALYDGDQALVLVETGGTFHIGDFEALEHFYQTRFRELTMRPLRQMVTGWVRFLAPGRIRKYGKYHKKTPLESPNGCHPPWWPRNCPYNEPSHLKHRDLIPLAVDIMMIHRRKDEECGKREKAWIAELRREAVHSVYRTPTDSFTSSKGEYFNEAMKKRALEIILPNLFDIAQSHEDYIFQKGLFEGSGREDPKTGKHITWQPVPRPDRTRSGGKRQRTNEPSASTHRPIHRALNRAVVDADVIGAETEVDDESRISNSVWSSFHSREFDFEECRKVERTITPPIDSVHVASMPQEFGDYSVLPPRPETAPPHFDQVPFAQFDQTLSNPHLFNFNSAEAGPADHPPQLYAGSPFLVAFGNPSHQPGHLMPTQPLNYPPFPHMINEQGHFTTASQIYPMETPMHHFPTEYAGLHAFPHPIQPLYNNIPLHGLPDWPNEADSGLYSEGMQTPFPTTGTTSPRGATGYQD